MFTTVNLFWNIKYRYSFGFFGLVKASPRFGIMLLSMCISILFIIVDLLAVTDVLGMGGLNPFWKIAFVFKCFTDTIILDDFKTALDKLFERQRSQIAMNSLHSSSNRSRWTRITGGDGNERARSLPKSAKETGIVVGTDITVRTVDAPSVHSTSEILHRPNERDIGNFA